MRVLVIDAYPPNHPDATVVRSAIEILEHAGNTVEVISLSNDEYSSFMTTAERLAYETDTPLLAGETKASAAAVRAAEALLFCYPTVLFGLPPVLKSWLERVMVVGVAFVFDDRNRIRPGMKNVVRLGAVTTTSHSRIATAKARDLGYRTIMRSLRLNCHPMCQRTFIRLAAGAPVGRTVDRLRRSLRGWS